MEREENNQEITTERSATDNKEQKSRSFVNKLFIGILVIALLALGGGLGWWYMKQSQPKVSQSTSSAKKKDIPKLIISTPDAKDNIYPRNLDSDYAYDQNFQSFEGLVRYENQSQIVPALAISWKNPDDTTWEFNLRKNVKFHTGRIMTAEDIVYSYEQAKKNEYINTTFFNSIKNISAKDSHSIIITTKNPDPILLNKLNFLLIIDRESNGKISPIYGTGPYTLKPGTVPTENKIELSAFDEYHGGRPSTREITYIQHFTDEDAIKNLVNKKANIAGDFLSTQPSLDAQKFIARKYSYIGITLLLPLAVKDGPLEKKEVRQAIKFALEYEKLATAQNISYNPAPQLVPQSIPGYNPSLQPVVQDIKKSKELLSKAGYPNGFTLRLSTYNVPNEGIKELQSQLALIGITLISQPAQSFDLLLDTIEAQGADLVFLAYASDTYDALDVYQNLVATYGKSTASTDLIDKIDNVTAITDVKKRNQELKNIALLVSGEVPVIPLYNRNQIWYMDKDYVLPRDMPGANMGIYFWKAYMKP